MAPYLADTTVLVDHFRDVQSATTFLLSQRPAISVVSVGELIEGAKNKRNLQEITILCGSLKVNFIDESICHRAVVLMNAFFLSNHLEFLDALIAATAIEHRLTLVTANTKHFSFIKGLKIKPWPSTS